MATKTKSKVYIHPAIDFSGADPRLVDAVMDGKPLICIRDDLGSRDGKRYERGDEIILGKYKNDGVYLRPHPLGGRPWVTTPEAYAFAQYDSERRRYERDILEPFRNRLNWAERDLGNVEGRVRALHAQLKQANSELKQARSVEKNASTEYKQALEAAPKAPA